MNIFQVISIDGNSNITERATKIQHYGVSVI